MANFQIPAQGSANWGPTLSGTLQYLQDNAPLAHAKTAMTGMPLVSYGHSFVVGSGISSPNKYAEQFAAMMGMTYPTLSSTGDLMRAVAGSRVEEAAQRIIGGTTNALFPWAPGTQYPVLVQSLINTARTNGADAPTWNGALHSLRTICAMIGSASVAPATNSRFTYSAGWTTASIPTSMSGTVYSIPTGGAATVNVQFTAPTNTFYVMILSRNASLTGNVVQIDNVSTGTMITSFNNTNTSAADTPGTYVPIVLKVRAAPGDTIKVSRPSGSGGAMGFDGLIIPGPTPPPIVLMKEPYLANYALSTSYPNGSDAVFDYFNGIIDQLSHEFTNIIVADPNTAGYWNKATMIQSDGVHPNDLGSLALAQTARDALLNGMPKMMARRAMGVFY